MTDPIALDPVLPPAERSRLPFNEAHRTHDERYGLFESHVLGGGKVEAGDWMPDEYRSSVLRFVEMHANSELMGVLPEREWILRAPTLRRKLALTAKVQDEVGHAQLLYRVAEDLGKPREAMIDDLLAGKTKFHNVFHYPTRTWADIGIIAWLVDAAAIVAQQALRDSSYAPYARTMRKICWEESVHIMHGRDVVVTMVTGRPEQRAMVQEALDRWWGPLMQMHGPRSERSKDRDIHWRIKAKTSEELRQEFLSIYVPRIFELGLTLPDPDLRYDEAAGEWRYGEPDWQELRTVVTNHGPKSEERLAFRRLNRADTQWVRDTLLSAPRESLDGWRRGAPPPASESEQRHLS
jgi:ring-1,2-phenylacetyl-CoA epoxidase subunit PaaA